LPALRVRSHYLALVTLGFGESLNLIFVNATPVTGGSIGIAGIPPATIGWMRFDNDASFALLALPVVILALLAAVSFVNSRFGRNLRALRDDATAARASGIDVGSYQLACFALSGLYAGIAGALYAVWLNYVSPASFDLSQSIFVLAQVLLGGAGTIVGPVIGAVALVSLHEALIALGDLQLIVYGLLIVILVLVARGGIAGLLSNLARGGVASVAGLRARGGHAP
jgi:ABC-type branched-subunit amino acid transport system permease subunit